MMVANSHKLRSLVLPAFDAPALIASRNKFAADIELRAQQAGRIADARTPGTGYTEIANGMAALAHGLYNDIENARDQLFVDSMSDETLLKRAAEKGILRIDPFFAQGSINVSGNDEASIPAGAIYQHVSGNEYRVNTTVIIIGGNASVALTAIEAGLNSNLIAGSALTATSTLPGINSDVAVDVNGITGGADVEPIERFKERYRTRLRAVPMGGKDYDYQEWARSAHVDVTRAFIFTHENGVGTVVIRIVTEDLDNTIPTQGVIDAVTTAIATLKPVEVPVTIEAPVARPLNLNFTSLVPDTPEVRASIEAEVRDMFRREAKPASTLLLSHIRAAISNAINEEDFAITLDSNIALAPNQFPTWGNASWPS